MISLTLTRFWLDVVLEHRSPYQICTWIKHRSGMGGRRWRSFVLEYMPVNQSCKIKKGKAGPSLHPVCSDLSQRQSLDIFCNVLSKSLVFHFWPNEELLHYRRGTRAQKQKLASIIAAFSEWGGPRSTSNYFYRAPTPFTAFLAPYCHLTEVDLDLCSIKSKHCWLNSRSVMRTTYTLLSLPRCVLTSNFPQSISIWSFILLSLQATDGTLSRHPVCSWLSVARWNFTGEMSANVFFWDFSCPFFSLSQVCSSPLALEGMTYSFV